MKLKALRTIHGLTTAELAKKVDIPEEKIIAWENGQENPSEKELFDLAVFFNVTPEYILGLTASITPLPTQHGVKCPHCESKNLAYVAEYHKVIGARVLQLILGFIFFVVLISGIEDLEDISPILIILLVAILIVQLYILAVESRTHVKCVCKDCGKTWIHD